MKVEFRADASATIGTGHVMRCLALAEALRERQAECRFLSSGMLDALIVSKGFAVDAEFRSADWLVVDHYALDARWESEMRAVAPRIAVIDDLADRRHDCDLLIDQNYFPQAESRYAALVPEDCRTLLGPRYALLRPEFAAARLAMAPRKGRARRLLVSLGGSDPGNMTKTAISAIRALGRRDLSVDVVIGEFSPHREEIERMCAAAEDFRIHVQAPHMAQLMAAADLALGAGGISAWERCCLGLPTIQLVLAPNQDAPTRALAEAGAITRLGVPAGEDEICAALAAALASPERLALQSRLAAQLVDGEGAKRAAAAILP